MGRSRSRSRSPAARSRSRSPAKAEKKKYHSSELHSVRIGNDLPDDIREEEIKEVFEKFGEIGDVFLPRERGSDRTRGFGYVRFVRKEDQDYCLKETADKIKVAGAETKVEFAPPRDRDRRDDRRGGGGRDSYYRDDRRGGGRDDYRRRSRSRSPRR